jgi:hypothetical protein
MSTLIILELMLVGGILLNLMGLPPGTDYLGTLVRAFPVNL